ncbi:MAG TPA: queuosine precursor transporter [Chlamydiales bacterium]|nr:queuosine precursor transporter [Chlamydiales bacterium]
MSNEFFFLIQFLLCIGFLLVSASFGKRALTVLVALSAVFANLFILKQIDLFWFTLTCSDLFAVTSMLALGFIQEYFGKGAALHAMKISFLALLFFTLGGQIHLLYTPAAVDRAHGAFETILSSNVRIVFSSLSVYYLMQRLEIFLFSKLRDRFAGKFFAFRVIFSLFVTQGLDTLLFSFFALYGVISPLLDVMLVSFFIKCIIIGFGAPIAAFSRRFITIQKEAG